MGDCISNRMAQARRFRRRDHCVDSGGNSGYQICRGSDALCAADAAENLEQSLCVCCRCGGHGAQPSDMRGDQSGYAQALSRGDHGIGGRISSHALSISAGRPLLPCGGLRLKKAAEMAATQKVGARDLRTIGRQHGCFQTSRKSRIPSPHLCGGLHARSHALGRKKRNHFARETGWRPPGQGNVSMVRTVIGEPMRD